MKRIGGKFYCHKNYISNFDPLIVDRAMKWLEVAQKEFGNFEWNCFREKYNSVAFQFSPDFDSADEPEVTKTYAVLNGVATLRQTRNIIWHHKWMWVDEDYKGFDYAASKARSALWKPHVSRSELTKIGNRVYWDSIRKRWEP